MDPLTYMAIAALIAFFSWLLNSYGKSVITVAKREVQSRWQYLFHKRNIVILGAAGSGKTSLIYFLKHGKPYQEVDGKVKPPEPTSGAVVIDTNVQISSETRAKWAKIAKDVTGDKEFRDLWKTTIREIDPHGIIYMVDGRLDNDRFKISVEDIFQDVLSEYTKGSGNLAALHVFLNFADYWAKDRAIRAERARAVDVYFERQMLRSEYRYLQNLKFQVSVVQLSSNRRSWEEAENALEKFGADLMGKK
jgi:GTPase SAR1 family protein